MLIGTRMFKGRVALGSMVLILGIGAAAAGQDPQIQPSTATDEPHPQAKILQTYDLSWWSVDGGGGTSTDGNFTLTGSIGQPDVGISRACGTVMSGGVWSGSEPCEAPVFCDGFESGDTGAWSLVSP